MRSTIVLFLFYALFQHADYAASDSGGAQPLKFKPPVLSDEESHSRFMPELLKCDACRVVSYQLYTHFDQFNKMHKQYKYNLPESEILDLIEGVCENSDVFNVYGLKTVKDVNRLSGPGLETKDFPGVLAGGGKWPGRLMEMCAQLVDEMGEEKVYATYRENFHNEKVLDAALCYGEGVFGQCRSVKEKQEL